MVPSIAEVIDSLCPSGISCHRIIPPPVTIRTNRNVPKTVFRTVHVLPQSIMVDRNEMVADLFLDALNCFVSTT